LRDRYVFNGLKDKLLRDYHHDPEDNFGLRLLVSLEPRRYKFELVRRESFRKRETKELVARIYWRKNGELIVNSLIDDGVRYQWDLRTLATKDWSSYQSAL